MAYPKSFEDVIEAFKLLPGIGNKGAERMAYHLLDMPDDQVVRFANAMTDFKKKIHYCKTCGHITEDEECEICRDNSRDKSVIVVVESPKDVFAMEKLKEYNGLYHVLGGTMSIMDGITADDLNVASLFPRITDEVKEVIIATNPTREGETTALLLARMIAKKSDVNVTRIANGLPIGSSLEYADELTLLRSFEGRQTISE